MFLNVFYYVGCVYVCVYCDMHYCCAMVLTVFGTGHNHILCRYRGFFLYASICLLYVCIIILTVVKVRGGTAFMLVPV